MAGVGSRVAQYAGQLRKRRAGQDKLGTWQYVSLRACTAGGMSETALLVV